MKRTLRDGTLNPAYWNGSSFILLEGAPRVDPGRIGRVVRVYKVSPGDRAVQISYRMRLPYLDRVLVIRASILLKGRELRFLQKR